MIDSEKDKQAEKVMEKTCLCTNLGTGSLIRLGIMKPSYGRQEICPGPNIAWFSREYSLQEMVDHIYGRGESLVPEKRPHMFAKELTMYVDYAEKLAEQADEDDRGTQNKLRKIYRNLEKGMDVCLQIADSDPRPGENLASLRETVHAQRERLNQLFLVEAS